MRVCLIALYGIENNGVRHISSVLKKHGHNVSMVFFKNWRNNAIDLPTERELEILSGLLYELKPELVGLSFGSSYFKIAKQLTSVVHKSVHAPVIYGGLHATVVPEKCIEVADMLCVGEGELTMLELVERLQNSQDISSVQNLWLKSNGQTVTNPLRPLIQDLDSLPFRDYSGENVFAIRRNKLYEGDPIFEIPDFRIICSRGCFFKCSYCYNSILRSLYKGAGKYYRLRSVRNVIDEIHYARSKFNNIRKVIFDDDVFCTRDEWLEEFAETYRKEVGIPFECLLHPTLIDEEKLKLLKSAGLRRLQIGIQSGSPREMSEVYERALPQDKLIEFSRFNSKLHLDVVYDVLLDDPLSTEEDKRELLEFIFRLRRPYNLFLYSLTVFPRTEIARKLLEAGLITERDIEGENDKTFRQFRVSLDYPRPPFDRFILALLVLVSKSFIPKSLIRWLYRRKFFERHPAPLMCFAYFANLIKMSWIALKMLCRGELSRFKLYQFSSLKRMLTQ